MVENFKYANIEIVSSPPSQRLSLKLYLQHRIFYLDKIILQWIILPVNIEHFFALCLMPAIFYGCWKMQNFLESKNNN